MIPGFSEAESQPISGDALARPVQWQDNADLSKHFGDEIRLKFCMTRARIHAMTLSDEDRKLGQVSTSGTDGSPTTDTPELI